MMITEITAGVAPRQGGRAIEKTAEDDEDDEDDADDYDDDEDDDKDISLRSTTSGRESNGKVT